MGALEQAAVAGALTTLFNAFGESLTFRGAPITAIVDRTPPDTPPAAGELRFTAEYRCRIELPLASVSSPPRVGEHLSSSGGIYFRIQEVSTDGHCWICLCQESST